MCILATSRYRRRPLSFDIHIMVVDVDPHVDLGRGFTGSDWFWDEQGNLQVRISRMSTWQREAALCIHETVEALLCKHNGVSQIAVDVFDHEFDATHTSDLNAGDDPCAPYAKEHCLATAVERILIAEFGECWKDYDRELEEIPLHARAKVKLRKHGLLIEGVTHG